jgi:hypothetical protein
MPELPRLFEPARRLVVLHQQIFLSPRDVLLDLKF